MSPRGPDIVSDRNCEQPAPGLGPPRSLQHADARCLATATFCSSSAMWAVYLAPCGALHASHARRRGLCVRLLPSQRKSVLRRFSFKRKIKRKSAHRRLIATVPPRPLTQQGGMAVSRLDGRGISLFPARIARGTLSTTCILRFVRFECAVTRIQSRTRFLGSSRFSRALPLEFSRPWVRCIADREVSLLSVRHITGGDVNPDCSGVDV